MKKSVYLKLQLKRAFRHYPSVLLVTFVAILGIAVTLGTLAFINNNSEDKQRINIGIVGNLRESRVEVVTYALENMDNLVTSVKFVELSREEADKAIKSGDIAGYIYIHDNYFEDMAYGENSAAKYVSADTPDDLGNIMASELAVMLSDMVVETQKGVYSAISIAKDNNAVKNLYVKIDELNFEYVQFVMNRQGIYEIEYLGVKDKLTYGGYYVCGFLVFFLMLWGISCNKLIASSNYGLYRLLYVRGLKIRWQVFGEYTGYLLVTFITFLVIFAGSFSVLSGTDVGIREFAGVNAFSGIGFAFKMLPVFIMFTLMHFMIYEMFTNVISSMLVQFIVSVGFGYVSGCFYPNTFFPEAVQSFASYLPSGAGFSYAGKMLTEQGALKEAIVILIYIVVFASVTCAIRRYRLKGDVLR